MFHALVKHNSSFYICSFFFFSIEKLKILMQKMKILRLKSFYFVSLLKLVTFIFFSFTRTLFLLQFYNYVNNWMNFLKYNYRNFIPAFLHYNVTFGTTAILKVNIAKTFDSYIMLTKMLVIVILV